VDPDTKLQDIPWDMSGEFYTEGTKHLFIFVAYPRKFVWSFQLKRTVPFSFIIIVVSLLLSPSHFHLYLIHV